MANKESTPIPINKASYTFGAIKEETRIGVEQDTDLVFKAIKRNFIFEEYDKHLLQTDSNSRRLLVHENRLIVKDGILMRKYYEECGQVPPSNINPLTPNNRISKSISRINGKTPRNHDDDPRMQIKILLPRISQKNQTMGIAVRRLY